MEIRTAACAGLLLACLSTPLLASDAHAAGLPGIRPYINLHYGHEDSMFNYTDPHAVRGAQLLSPSQEHVFGGSIGADIGRYFGAAFAFDYAKTDLDEPSGKKAGDYSTSMFLGQLRLRYPMLAGRLVPYMLVGGGMGLGEFSGRKDFSYNVRASDWAPLGVAGVGADYFIARDLALNLEAKYFFDFHPDVQVNGVTHALTANAVGVYVGLRAYLDDWATGPYARSASEPPPHDSDAFRPYIALRGGKAIFTQPGAISNLTIDRSSGILGSGAVGANFNRHWGAELGFEYTRAQLRSPGFGRVSGYPVGTVAALVRFRYPIWHERISPYLIAGPGLGFAQEGDPDLPNAQTGFHAPTTWTLVGVFGGGVDYFLADNVAFDVEVKQTSFFDTTVHFGGKDQTLKPDFLSVSAGLRIFLP